MIHPKDSFVWEIEIKGINTDEISPKKSLYWLTGGDTEWKTLPNYRNPWGESYLEYIEGFGMSVINIVGKSKTIGDITSIFYFSFIKSNLSTRNTIKITYNLIKH
jgi:hypothetical protein